MMLKSEHAQTVSHLTSQNEVLRSSFREQARRLQDEQRKAMEALQQQLSQVEAQLFQLRSEPAAKGTWNREAAVVHVLVFTSLRYVLHKCLRKENIYQATASDSVMNELWTCSLRRSSTLEPSGVCVHQPVQPECAGFDVCVSLPHQFFLSLTHTLSVS